eukprot:CAMPEP_0206420490 /NCGR_PEP_ID=MMETSP0324_2-20121206/873_1 /ASSEMBLY_ACC=CAM_ASM_000836 /TAXON_ID=2866 /ORGANISM="Crypthecodinium cohnii, Strain Seligo" /LENGTH=1614 /DNA_ID=CAMNT_0053884383 /DNA_START=33 /DNA_END=4877 /DNA_ORIENTATION=-
MEDQMLDPTERRNLVAKVCQELGAVFGFQADSIRSQTEHIVALWESFLSRQKEGDPEAALRSLAGQLLRTQRAWYKGVWEPLTGQVWEDFSILHDVSLYWLIWGELGNVRYCPEIGCYLFAAARAYWMSPVQEARQCQVQGSSGISRGSLSILDPVGGPPTPSTTANGLSENLRTPLAASMSAPAPPSIPRGLGKWDVSFVRGILKPLFEVMLTETFKPGEPPTFKFGKHPAPAAHDDWNEVFWDPVRLSRVLLLKTEDHERGSRFSFSFFQSARKQLHKVARSPDQVWPHLFHVDWAAQFETSQVAPGGTQPLPVARRLLPHLPLAHSLSFLAMILVWTSKTDTVQWCSLGLVAPFWMWIYSIGFQALTPALAPRSRVKKLVKLICFDSSPVLTFFLVYGSVEKWWKLPTSDFSLLGLNFHLEVSVESLVLIHIIVSALTFLTTLRARRQNLYRWRFFPVMGNSWMATSSIFWIIVMAAKVGLDFLVTQYVGWALDHLWLLEGDYLTDPSWYKVPLFFAHFLLLTGAPALCLFGSLPLVSNVAISIVGFLRGLFILGGLRSLCHRWGIGMSGLPLRLMTNVCQLPAEPRAQWMGRWWTRMTDRELAGFVDVWNTFMAELRRKDLLSDDELRSLQCDDAESVRQGLGIPKLLNMVNTFQAALPLNTEARRRILTLARAANTTTLPDGQVKTMPHLSVLIPHYSETIMFTRDDLITRNGSTEMIRFLVQYYKDEFSNVAERLGARGSRGQGEHDLERARTVDSTDLEETLCKWASLRMQTLYRTIEGICNAYKQALHTVAKLQDASLSANELDEVCRGKVTIVVAMQRYALFADPTKSTFNIQEAAATEAMLQEFGKWISIAYIDEEVDEDGVKRFFSCLIDAECGYTRPIFNSRSSAASASSSAAAAGKAVAAGLAMRKPKYRIELPGFPLLGHGKSDNQNCAVIYTRGEILQMIDSNQEAYYESALFLPLALQEFGEFRNGRRPGILGFREHIFSDIGLVGRLAADSEFAFGTMLQRTMDWPLQARLHYGHPDMMDKLQMVQQGGVSKATRGLNLSEDIFAGMDLTLRGGWTKYKEYFHVGKGRDMGFISVLGFHAKVSMGNGEQALTRQWMRLGLSLPLPRLLGMFYLHTGFYLNQCLMNWAAKGFAFMVACFGLATIGNEALAKPAEVVASNYFGILYLLFTVAAMGPLLCEVLLEQGFRAFLMNFANHLASLSPVFAAFQSKLLAFYFENTVYYGGASYIGTGRGLATQREALVKLFRMFAPSHFNDAFEVSLFLFMGRMLGCGAFFWTCMCLAIFSWTMAPFLYNPRQYDSPLLVLKDFGQYMKWLISTEGSEDKSWEVWARKLQDVKKGSSVLWLFLPSRRFLCALCTGILITQVLPSGSTALYRALTPPIWMLLFCLIPAILEIYNQNLRVHTRWLALVAVALTSAELIRQCVLEEARARPAMLLYKYMAVRCMLDWADWVAAHELFGCGCQIAHVTCRTWAFSMRWVRDFSVGVILFLVMFLISGIPGVHWLHEWFLHRAQPREGDSVKASDAAFEALMKQAPPTLPTEAAAGEVGVPSNRTSNFNSSWRALPNSQGDWLERRCLQVQVPYNKRWMLPQLRLPLND